jgi:NAD(P)-dependent dehydrogenase (short-subunit alcohol dehydrogenase family)
MTTPRIWLITGASSGFGLKLAKAAAAHGDNVIATSRNPQKMSTLNLPSNIKLARLDQNEPLPQIKAAMQEIISIFGTVDIVVNNARICANRYIRGIVDG